MTVSLKKSPLCLASNVWVQILTHYLTTHVLLLLLLSSFSRVLTLCDPIDSSPPGFPIPGILQARTLEWVAISFSSAWKCKVKVKSLSRVRLVATPWTAAYQAPPPMGFPRQEYWSGVPLPSPTYSGFLKQLFTLENKTPTSPKRMFHYISEV